MIIESCNDNNVVSLFSFINYCLLMAGIIILFIIFINSHFKDKKILDFNSRIIICFFGVFLFILLILLFKYEVVNACSYEKLNYKSLSIINEHLNETNIPDISSNKVIIIGDSRMELIYNSADELEIPINFDFIAKSNTRIKWFEEFALPDLISMLDNAKEGYNYHVVINMGVNDLQENIVIDDRVSEYFMDYKKLVKKYPNVIFYILSVNPINDEKLNEFQPYNIRTTDGVEKFNDLLIKKTRNFNSSNLVYCDSYHDIYFKTLDGIHYKNETNQEILNYIATECVNYNKEKNR